MLIYLVKGTYQDYEVWQSVESMFLYYNFNLKIVVQNYENISSCLPSPQAKMPHYD